MKETIGDIEMRPSGYWEAPREKSQRAFGESGAEVPGSVKLINEGCQKRDDMILNAAIVELRKSRKGGNHDQDSQRD